MNYTLRVQHYGCSGIPDGGQNDAGSHDPVPQSLDIDLGSGSGFGQGNPHRESGTVSQNSVTPNLVHCHRNPVTVIHPYPAPNKMSVNLDSEPWPVNGLTRYRYPINLLASVRPRGLTGYAVRTLMRKQMTHRYKAISLFSGAMGLDIGLEQTGRFDVLACVEIEPSFCDTIRKNHAAGRLHSSLKIFQGSVSNIDPNDVLAAVGLKKGEVDILVGGPPCQSFSTAGRRRTIQDPRGTLLWQFLRWIEVIQPKFFLMENVRGLLSAALSHRPIAERPEKGGAPLSQDEQPGSVVRAFANELQNLNGYSYHMDIFEVNAVNYGAPQLRERALFIGNRFNSSVEFSEPTHGINDTEDGQILFDWNVKKKLQPWATLGDAIRGLTEINPVIMDFSPRKKSYLAKVPQGSNWRSLSIEDQMKSMGRAWHAKGGRSGWWRRLSYDLPCPTLVTMPNHASTSLCHPTEVRALTLREYLRIQEFPSDWEVFGKTPEQYAQIGNAVPVRLGRVAGDVIAKEMDALSKNRWVEKKSKLDSYRVIYIQSHIRTRQWFKNGKTFIWEDDGECGNATYSAPVTKKRVSRIR